MYNNIDGFNFFLSSILYLLLAKPNFDVTLRINLVGVYSLYSVTSLIECQST